MDPLFDVLSLLAIRGYQTGGFDMGRDLSLRFSAHQGIKCYAVTAGEVWLALDGPEPPVRLQAGDCFILPHGRPFRMATDLLLPPQDFHTFIAQFGTDRLAALNGGGGPQVLGSFFAFQGPGADMLLTMLPPVVHLRSDEDRETLRANFARMRQELLEDRPGSTLVVQQLATVTLIQALRLHLDASDGVGWLFALADRQVAAALRAMHADPARRWTVGTLASEAGMSRSSFAARFRARVGDGPIEYLTRWRMLLAGRDLARGTSVGTVSRALGYESESAFSTAFKRVMGHPPRRHGRLPLEEALAA
jgi:AraC-like DNA-binding protein